MFLKVSMSKPINTDDISISTDKSILDFEILNNFLLSAYWSKNRTVEQIKTAVDNSDCFGLYLGNRQIGFARVMTDRISLAFLFDVFVLEEFRGHGYGKLLVGHVVNFPEFKNVKKWMLGTLDAHKLYEKYGFRALRNPEKLMEMLPEENKKP